LALLTQTEQARTARVRIHPYYPYGTTVGSLATNSSISGCSCKSNPLPGITVPLEAISPPRYPVIVLLGKKEEDTGHLCDDRRCRSLGLCGSSDTFSAMFVGLCVWWRRSEMFQSCWSLIVMSWLFADSQQLVRLRAIMVVDIVTESAIFVLPPIFLSRLNMATRKKYLVVIAFSSRLPWVLQPARRLLLLTRYICAASLYSRSSTSAFNPITYEHPALVPQSSPLSSFKKSTLVTL
jgi:hypothetical protein